jgi:hypothetical protein
VFTTIPNVSLLTSEQTTCPISRCYCEVMHPNAQTPAGNTYLSASECFLGMYAGHVHVCGPSEQAQKYWYMGSTSWRSSSVSTWAAAVWKAGLQYLAAVIFFLVTMYTLYMEPTHMLNGFHYSVASFKEKFEFILKFIEGGHSRCGRTCYSFF